METIIPSYGTLPVPAPVWLLQILLVFTFILHVVFMNVLFGGTILGAFSTVKGKRDENHAHLAQRMFGSMPVVIAFTVSLGVAPLLFLQVLYGSLMYTSSILIAWFWFAVVPLVIIAYYLLYLLRFRWEKLTDYRQAISWTVALIVAVVGFIYVNNMTLMLRPEHWRDHYFASMSTGALNWGDPQVYPRYLHMLLGAVAVAGMWIMFLAFRDKTPADRRRWMAGYGAKVFVYATVANIIVGLWFVMAHPKRVYMIFMGQNMPATILMTLGILLSVGMVFIVHRAGKAEDGRKLTWIGAGHLFAVLVVMAVMREQLRQAYLEPYFAIGQLQPEPQWGVFGLFVVLLLGGLGTVIWMLRAVVRDRIKNA